MSVQNARVREPVLEVRLVDGDVVVDWPRPTMKTTPRAVPRPVALVEAAHELPRIRPGVDRRRCAPWTGTHSLAHVSPAAMSNPACAIRLRASTPAAYQVEPVARDPPAPRRPVDLGQRVEVSCRARGSAAPGRAAGFVLSETIGRDRNVVLTRTATRSQRASSRASASRSPRRRRRAAVGTRPGAVRFAGARRGSRQSARVFAGSSEATGAAGAAGRDAAAPAFAPTSVDTSVPSARASNVVRTPRRIAPG